MHLIAALMASPLVYLPDLAPVGSQSAYWPRDIEDDADALNFLGFIPDDVRQNGIEPSHGSQSADMNAGAGAWDPNFRAGVTAFQASRGITADSWIGPQTRTQLAAAVAVRNAAPHAPLPTVPPIVPFVPGLVPVSPNVPEPAGKVTEPEDNTMTYVGVGAALVAVAGVIWYKRKHKAKR